MWLNWDRPRADFGVVHVLFSGRYDKVSEFPFLFHFFASDYDFTILLYFKPIVANSSAFSAKRDTKGSLLW